MLDTKLPTAKIYVQGKKLVNFSKVLNFRDVTNRFRRSDYNITHIFQVVTYCLFLMLLFMGRELTST